MNFYKSLFGEFLGTLILTFVGCSTVALAVIYGVFPNIIPIALIWGLGVTIAIYATKGYSKSHLNPAVSAAFYRMKEISFQQLLGFWIAQLAGGITAGLLVYLVFNDGIAQFELNNGIIRGDDQSFVSASIFGEFFPNPGYISEIPTLSLLSAVIYEALGTFCLMTGILIIISLEKLSKWAPILIGLLVASLIMWLAPFTQCGMNPARDFGPRLVAFCSGWGDAAFPKIEYSFLSVYIVAPIVGGVSAALIFNILKSKFRVTKN